MTELDVEIQCDTVYIDINVAKMRCITWQVTSSNTRESRIISRASLLGDL